MKKHLAFLLAVLFFLFPLAISCASPGGGTGAESEPGYPYTFEDSTGATVTLTAKPKKVAVLFSSYADIWKTAGGQVAVTVGESVTRGFADGGAVLVDPGAGHSSIDLEALLSCEPDFVIGTADYDCQRDAVAFCRSIGIPAAAFTVETFSDYLSLLRIFCTLTGDEDAYRIHGANVSTEIEHTLAAVSAYRETSGKPAPRILFVRAGSSAKSTKAKNTTEHFACVMLAELGADNIADTETSLSGSLSLEAIVAGDPDFLFISTMGDETAAKDYMNSLLTSPGWRELSCVKNGNFSYLSKDLFQYKPNANWAQAYRILAQFLFPEIDLA